MSKTFLERLKAGEILVADGATGTNHQVNGLPIGVPPEEWVFDEPEKVKALHRAFVEAGSDIILTCTFGGTRLRLSEASKYADRAAELNRRAAELARQAAGKDIFVAGSMGPTGKLMQPLGELAEDQVVENYAEQAKALTEGGCDLLVLETFFALDEAEAAIKGVKAGSQLPLVVSFSYDQGTRTMMGLRPSQVAQAIAPSGVAMIGANCGKTLESMEEIVKEIKAENSGLPIWVKPNAGLPRMVGDTAVYDATPEIMADFTGRYLCAAAQVVGGCCGSTPAHVAAIAKKAKI